MFKNLATGFEKTTPWEVLSFEVNGFTVIYLETNEEVWHNRIGMEKFSEKYMYGSGRVDDADIYIYEKR